MKALSQSHKPEAGKKSTKSAFAKDEEASIRNEVPQSIATSSNGISPQGTTITGATNASDPAPPESISPQSEAATVTSATSNLQQVMADRRRRLEADKAAKDAAEKEKRKAVAQAQREAASAAPGTPVSQQSSYAQQQRKRQREAKEERQRILRAIESDKAERKVKEAQRRALAEAEAVDANQASKSTDLELPSNRGAAPHAQQCSLQIRLFDGTTLRGKFESHQTLNNDVRPWIADQRTDGDMPYTLKQILTPLPNRTIGISEEEESLQSLGLLPSATLVMVPIQDYIGAYSSNQGVVSKAVSIGYNAASIGGSMLKGALGTVLAFGRATSDTQEIGSQERRVETSSDSDRQTAAAAAREGVSFRTLSRHHDGSEDHELYNGNQVLGNLAPPKRCDTRS
ncbi:MAG: hypothetical protein Q9225_002893 [Loekoesia sp. 1 TL-2023]